MSPSPKYRRKLKASQLKPEPVARHVWTVKPSGTVWVGLLMLVLGALCGITVQPLFISKSNFPSPTETTATISQTAMPSQPSPTQDNSPRGAMMRGVVSQTRHFQGDENAPVTIVEFCDFEVPDCSRFTNEVYRQLKSSYIDTGKVHFGFWPMVTQGEGSQLAAEAAECASEQDNFWQFYQAVYTDEANSSLNFDRTDLNNYALMLGLDTAAFSDCLDSGKYTSLIKEGTTTIQDLGLPDVPTFLVNGQPLVGFQSFEAFQQTIDSILSGQ